MQFHLENAACTINFAISNEYKIFIWDEFNRDYASGIAFAIAKSVEEARTLVMQAELDEYGIVSTQTEIDLEEEPRSFLVSTMAITKYGGS